MRRLVELLGHASTSVETAALRTIGNVVSGDDRQTQWALDAAGTIDPDDDDHHHLDISPSSSVGRVRRKKKNALLWGLQRLLWSCRRNLRRESCWALSNITAGSRAQLEVVLESGVAPPLVALLRGLLSGSGGSGGGGGGGSAGEEESFEDDQEDGVSARLIDEAVRSEAAWALMNFTVGGSANQVLRLAAESNLVDALCFVLRSSAWGGHSIDGEAFGVSSSLSASDTKLLMVSLEAMSNVLDACRHANDEGASGTGGVGAVGGGGGGGGRRANDGVGDFYLDQEEAAAEVACQFVNCGGQRVLEELKERDACSPAVRAKASELLSYHFVGE